MADDVKIAIKGLSAFARQCRAIGKDAQAELRGTNLKAAQVVVPEAQRRAPKGPHEGGGKIVPIAASIRAFGGHRYASIRAGGARTRHAAPYEFGGVIARRGFSGLSRTEKKFGVRFSAGGTRLRGRTKRAEGETRRGATVTKIPARPYVWPAIEAKQQQVEATYMDDFVSLIGRAFPF